MKILHISDWHGEFLFPKEEYDIVVSSGDMLKTFTRGLIRYEVPAQRSWLKENISKFKKIIGQRPFLGVSGNHDFISLAKILKENRINSFDLDNSSIEIEGVSFAGFPYIPYIAGEWNYEEMGDSLRRKTISFLEKNKGIDIFIMHCGPCGILDESDHFAKAGGNIHLTNHLYYDMNVKDHPKMVLCGHFHNNHGLMEKDGILFSNAATTYHFLEIKNV